MQLQLAWPEHVSYELIRPVVLFGFSAAERAKQTGVPERTLRRKADRFDTEGMTSLSEPMRTPALRNLSTRAARNQNLASFAKTTAKRSMAGKTLPSAALQMRA